MTGRIVHSVPGLVTVRWRPDLRAVQVAWELAFTDSAATRSAIRKAMDFATRNRLKNWLYDARDALLALDAPDVAWLSGGEVRAAVKASSLRRFVMMRPRAYADDQIDCPSEWESRICEAFGAGTQALLSNDMARVAAFFEAHPITPDMTGPAGDRGLLVDP